MSRHHADSSFVPQDFRPAYWAPDRLIGTPPAQERVSAYGTGLERVIQQAIDAGASFKLEVTGPESGERHPDLPEREEIDVTPGPREAL